MSRRVQFGGSREYSYQRYFKQERKEFFTLILRPSSYTFPILINIFKILFRKTQSSKRVTVLKLCIRIKESLENEIPKERGNWSP